MLHAPRNVHAKYSRWNIIWFSERARGLGDDICTVLSIRAFGVSGVLGVSGFSGCPDLCWCLANQRRLSGRFHLSQSYNIGMALCLLSLFSVSLLVPCWEYTWIRKDLRSVWWENLGLIMCDGRCYYLYFNNKRCLRKYCCFSNIEQNNHMYVFSKASKYNNCKTQIQNFEFFLVSLKG